MVFHFVWFGIDTKREAREKASRKVLEKIAAIFRSLNHTDAIMLFNKYYRQPVPE